MKNNGFMPYNEQMIQVVFKLAAAMMMMVAVLTIVRFPPVYGPKSIILECKDIKNLNVRRTYGYGVVATKSWFQFQWSFEAAFGGHIG